MTYGLDMIISEMTFFKGQFKESEPEFRGKYGLCLSSTASKLKSLTEAAG
jgi:hypothetical protein